MRQGFGCAAGPATWNSGRASYLAGWPWPFATAAGMRGWCLAVVTYGVALLQVMREYGLVNAHSCSGSMDVPVTLRKSSHRVPGAWTAFAAWNAVKQVHRVPMKGPKHELGRLWQPQPRCLTAPHRQYTAAHNHQAAPPQRPPSNLYSTQRKIQAAVWGGVCGPRYECCSAAVLQFLRSPPRTVPIWAHGHPLQSACPQRPAGNKDIGVACSPND